MKFLVNEGGPDVESKDKWGQMVLDLTRQRSWKEGCKAVDASLEERKMRGGGG